MTEGTAYITQLTCFSEELNLDKSVTQQSTESTFHFVLAKKGENPDLVQGHETNPATPGTPHFLSLDDEEPILNGSSGLTRDRTDSVFDSDNPDLQVCSALLSSPVLRTLPQVLNYLCQVPAKSLLNVQMEGWLKKLTTKKDWKKRYFVLKDKNLYYYSSPQVTTFSLLFLIYSSQSNLSGCSHFVLMTLF